MKTALLTAAAAMAIFAAPAHAQQAAQLTSDEQAFQTLYKEMVETNTTRSVGSCTALSEKIRDRLLGAGFAAGDVQILAPTEHPQWGNLVAVLRGSNAKAKPILLLAHIDVVEAKREDWKRDPFVLTEENGMFYGRGVADDKSQAAVWADTLIRLKSAKVVPKRDIKMALTCGEETPDTFDGAEWLVKNHRPLIDAAFALNEGAGGRLDDQGRHVSLSVQQGEKVYQSFQLEVTNPGGHSSTPIRENAAYRLAAGMLKLQNYDFPVHLSDGTRGYFTGMAPSTSPEAGAAMRAIVANPADAAAAAVLSKDRGWNSMLRTTCVVTTVKAGHADNALPQRATATVNCRIMPGTPVETVRQGLVDVIADPQVAITVVPPTSPTPPPPPLTSEMLDPVKSAAAKVWPGVPVIPFMSTGATDGRFLNASGIPTYGVTGFFHDAGGPNAHGLDEHIRVRSLFDGRTFLFHLVKAYAGIAPGK